MCVQINGKHIEWQQLWKIYNKQATLSSKSKGICFDPKLKLEHMKLTSYSRMRVDLAVQVGTIHIIMYMPVLIVIHHTGVEQNSFRLI